jgi:hypothetical protein
MYAVGLLVVAVFQDYPLPPGGAALGALFLLNVESIRLRVVNFHVRL